MDLRIKQVCKDKGITYNSLSEQLGISRQSLSKSVKNNPTIETISKIAGVLKVDPIELIEPTSDYAHFYSDGQWHGIRKK